MLKAREHTLIDTFIDLPNTAAVKLHRRGDIIDIRVEVNDLTEKVKDAYLELYSRSAGSQTDTHGLFVVVEAGKDTLAKA